MTSCCSLAVFSKTSARMWVLFWSLSSSSITCSLISFSSFLRRSIIAVLLVKNDLSVFISHSAARSLSVVVFIFSKVLSSSYGEFPYVTILQIIHTELRSLVVRSCFRANDSADIFSSKIDFPCWSPSPSLSNLFLPDGSPDPPTALPAFFHCPNCICSCSIVESRASIIPRAVCGDQYPRYTLYYYIMTTIP